LHGGDNPVEITEKDFDDAGACVTLANELAYAGEADSN